jgi:hypothetical protein
MMNILNERETKREKKIAMKGVGEVEIISNLLIFCLINGQCVSLSLFFFIAKFISLVIRFLFLASPSSHRTQ